MKKIISLIILSTIVKFAAAQKVDSIFFHLYTDSLKKGTHNYINVDGKLSNGKWTPLTTSDIKFSTTYGEFEGNELVLPDNPKQDKVTIRAELKSNPAIWKEVTIWVKRRPDDEKLKTNEEILRDLKKAKKKKDT